MKINLSKFVILLALALAFTNQSKAGFPIGNGRYLLVPTYTKYSATGYWDNAGNVKNYGSNGRFTSSYFGLYGGFGVGRDVDLIYNIPFVTNRYTENGIDVDSKSPLQTSGDVMVGLTYFLNNYDNYKHLSLTGALLVPTYPSLEATTLLPGFASVGGEIKLGLAGTNTTNWQNTYYDIEAGLRSYFNNGGPSQFFANATLGIPLDEHLDWKLAGTINGVWSSSSGGNGYVAPTTGGLFVNRDFSYLRGSIGLGRRLSRSFTLWATIFRDLSGKSIGQGQGFQIHGVIKF